MASEKKHKTTLKTVVEGKRNSCLKKVTEAHKWNAFSLPNVKWISDLSTLTNQITNFLEAGLWFYIYLTCFLWHNKVSFIHSHSITGKYNFSKIAKRYRSFIAQFFVILFRFLTNPNFWGCAYNPVPLTPSPALLATPPIHERHDNPVHVARPLCLWYCKR